jgi:hypothetical protein
MGFTANSKNKQRSDIRGIHESKVYQPRPNFVKDDNGVRLVDSDNTLNRWKNYFCQLLQLNDVNNVRQAETLTAEP